MPFYFQRKKSRMTRTQRKLIEWNVHLSIPTQKTVKRKEKEICRKSNFPNGCIYSLKSLAVPSSEMKVPEGLIGFNFSIINSNHYNIDVSNRDQQYIPRRALSQFFSFKVRRTTFRNYIKFVGLLIVRLQKCERVRRASNLCWFPVTSISAGKSHRFNACETGEGIGNFISTKIPLITTTN